MGGTGKSTDATAPDGPADADREHGGAPPPPEGPERSAEEQARIDREAGDVADDLADFA